MGGRGGLDWHAMEVDAVARHFEVDVARGLDDVAAEAALARHGLNRPAGPAPRGWLARLGAQLIAPLVLVLIAAGLVTALLGEWVDAGVIVGVVVVNAIVGLIQEGKAEAALAALARSVTTEATVLRGGRAERIDSTLLVPGDLVVFGAGDKVPADVRLVSGKELRSIEAALTGESLPVDKQSGAVASDASLAERSNMAFAGSLVVAGQARGIVVATGDETEAGRIARLMAQAPQIETPLTRKLEAFSHHLLVAILVLAGLTFVVGIVRGESAFEMFMAAVALAIGAIPEGLPAAMTIVLAIGVARMARRNAIIRRLPAVETLGSTTVICSDKTGTLTENAMTVREAWVAGVALSVTGEGYDPVGEIRRGDGAAEVPAAWREVLHAAALCNDAHLVREQADWRIVGDPTEGALIVLARKGGLEESRLGEQFPRIDELPFDAARQTMATLHDGDGTRRVYVKGAVERILPACQGMIDPQGREVRLDGTAISAAALRMADDGLRVLALARSVLPCGQSLAEAHLERGLVFLGLVGMIDPPRPGALAAVRACHAAGIRVKMITGDHPGTATAIARLLEIAPGGERALSGRELAAIDDRDLPAVASACNVFARVEPEQKLRLVRALQARGEVVAMTGDGVNDAPALKQADIGVAMGRGGTEVAKEAADMVLTDDNFATIQAAVEEGRGVYDNLIKFIAWTIPTNAGEGLVILAAVVAGVALPIAPLQILWINMTTAVLLGMALAFEPAEGGIMGHPPRPPGEPILDTVLLLRTALVSLVMLMGAFGLFEWALHRGLPLEQARTIAANLFVLVEILYLFNCRSLRRPFWQCRPNRWVWAGAAAMLGLQLAFTYAPGFNRVFQTAPIGVVEWLPILGIAALCATLVETEKWWRRHATIAEPPAPPA